ncbi:MAG: DNRLRE domain-containing protein [Chthoniobacter sp.]
MKLKLLLLFFCSGVTAAVFADVVNLGANHDTTIFQNNVTNSAGAAPGIFAGTNGASSPRRGLMSFDLSSIPAGAIITNVQLTLTVGQIAGSGGSGGTSTETIGLFALSSGWGEGTNGASSSIGGGGQGNAALPTSGDATWSSSAYSQTPWLTPGGDFVSPASASLLLLNATPGASFTWLSTAQLVADVQGWLNNPAMNHGWELINADETDPTTFDAFYSREGMSVAGVTASQLPDLQITYTVPEPVSGSLAAVAILAMCCLRPRHRRA